MSTAPLRVVTLGSGDVDAMRAMLSLFGEAFGEDETYNGAQPDAAYLQRLLGSDTFIAIAASKADEIVGALAAYVLPKFEQARSEIYI
ncbi:MAG TPA: AAC(3)-I family aminoglycoside 3-N-acetyltransferase, partial [Rhodanobacteraceae bacterium]|nr:AAC(3)-I family aminoglycoside 3-N-acetyltransferase [Rhodanobacteraceae bacterium]